MEYSIIQLESFSDWFERLSDQRAVEIITQRLVRVSAGVFGDVKFLGKGVSELRIHYGPGYRIYFTIRQRQIILLLAGGT